MNREARETYRQYMKNWRLKNKDKLKKYQKTYWEKKAAEAKKEGK